MSRPNLVDRMKERAPALFDRFKQGTVVLVRPAQQAPASGDEWDKPVRLPPVDFPLVATVEMVDQRYENGALIVETGFIVMFLPPQGTEPVMSDKLRIDGTERVLTSLKHVPGAGPIVYWTAFCKA